MLRVMRTSIKQILPLAFAVSCGGVSDTDTRGGADHTTPTSPESSASEMIDVDERDDSDQSSHEDGASGALDPSDADAVSPGDRDEMDLASGGETSAPARVDDFSDLFEPVAGSRLFPVFRVADDGMRVHVGWHDSLLGGRCEFRDAAGTLACLPVDTISTPTNFADAECSEPVVSPSDVPDGGSVVVINTRCANEGFLELGAPIEGGVIWRPRAGGCEPREGFEGYRRLEAFDPSMFVTATETPVDGSGRIVPVLLEAADGARQISAAWDRLHAEMVSAQLDDQGELRWLSRWRATHSDEFTDESCSVEAAVAPACTPPDAAPTTAFQVLSFDQCGGTSTQPHRLDAADEHGVLFQGSTCYQNESPARGWTLGEPMDFDEFAIVSLHPSVGSRLTHDTFGTPEGEPLLPSRVFSDPRFENELCEFLDLGAGDLVCVPRAAEVVNSYLDEFCVRPVAHYVDLRGYGCDPNFRYAVDPPQVYELGEPSPWGIKRRDASGACVDDEWGQPDGPGQFVWEMGQHIPIEMVRARDVIEMP